MWGWLNSNANAIEAIIAVLSVRVTAILVVITVRYVRLTQTLADVALRQLQAQAEALKARRRELQASANLLLQAPQSHAELSQRRRATEMIQSRIRWDDFDFSRFRELAARKIVHGKPHRSGRRGSALRRPADQHDEGGPADACFLLDYLIQRRDRSPPIRPPTSRRRLGGPRTWLHVGLLYS